MVLHTSIISRLFTGVFFACTMGIASLAQVGKGKDEKVPVFHYVIDDPMDAFGRQPSQTPAMRIVSLPDFCRNQPKVGDTVKWFEFYNAAHEIMLPDSASSPRSLHFVSMLEGYTDSLHTYRDAQGKQQLLPVSRITQRYDRIGGNKWLFVNYKNNKTVTISEFSDETVVTDTVSSADGTMVVRRFFRTGPQK